MFKRKNNFWKFVLAGVAILGAIALALFLLIRTERRLYRLLGVLESYLPRKRKQTEFRIDL